MNLSVRIHGLQRMSRLFHGLLIALSSLTIIQPPLRLRVILLLNTQLSRQDESRREVHHDIRRGELITEKPSTLAILQSGLEEVHVVPHVLAHLFFRLSNITAFLVPAGVEDRYAVKSPGSFCRVYPL